MRPRGLAFVALLVAGGPACAGSSSKEETPKAAGAGGGGTAGTGNGGAGTAGTGGEPESCPGYEHDSKMFASMTGALDEVNDLPALVERSTEGELVLYVEQLPAGAAEPVVGHARLFGLDPMPALELGAEVRLSMDPVRLAPGFVPAQPWAFSVRDQNGRLLFGSAFAVGDSSDAAPLTATIGEPLCAKQNPFCAQVQDAEVVFHSVEIHGDSTVLIDDGAPATVALDGVDYDVWATGKTETAGNIGCAADYYPPAGPTVSLDVRAEDLAALTSALGAGELPACIQGNAALQSMAFSLYNAASGTAFEGPVIYERLSDAGNELYFTVPGLMSYAPVPAMVGIAFDGDVPIELEPGTELWASLPEIGFGSLREGPGGPLLLAGAIEFSMPFDAATAATFEELLGVPVLAEERCTYATDAAQGTPIPLWDVVFDSDPPLRLQSGTEGVLSLDGREYTVWAWGQDYVGVSVFAR